MPHVLHVIHGSHPCVAAARALELAGQPYRTVELMPAAHLPVVWLRFRRLTVPALELGNGERIVGSRAIARRLDELVPAAALLPADPAARARVLEAERWGDEVLQPVPRQLFWQGIGRRPEAIHGYAEGSRLPLPRAVRGVAAPVVGALGRVRHRASEASLERDLAALPALLDVVDGHAADGTIGGERPNAADLQLLSAVRLLGTFADLRPLLEGRPAWEHARRVFPAWAGEMPAGTYPLPASAGPRRVAAPA